MNVLIVDYDCCGLDLACRASEEDHKVKLYIPPHDSGARVQDGDGFPGIERVNDWKSHLKWSKNGLVVLLDNANHLKEFDMAKSYGFPIIAPSVASAKLEINRGAGMKAFQESGIDVPDYKTFKSLKDAEQYQRKHSSQTFVFKTLGDEEDKSLSYVGHSPADMVSRLQSWQKQGMKLKGECMLQEKIDGIEMGVSGWMGTQGFIEDKWNINFEFKKLMSGNYGPNTGEMGTVMQYVKDDHLADQVLKPLEKTLKKLKHLGDLAVNCIIDKKGNPWPLEFTCRFGWPAFYLQCAEQKNSIIDSLKGLLEGKDKFEVSYDPCIGIVVAQPQYPYSDIDPREFECTPIYGLDEVWDHSHPWRVMISKGPEMDGDKIVDREVYRTCGEYALCVTALGSTVKAARTKVYDTIKKIKIPNMIVRDDIGERLEKELPELHRLNYATTMEY